jgi:hypothetical protein
LHRDSSWECTLTENQIAAPQQATAAKVSLLPEESRGHNDYDSPSGHPCTNRHSNRQLTQLALPQVLERILISYDMQYVVRSILKFNYKIETIHKKIKKSKE